jgi:hypothetical protein
MPTIAESLQVDTSGYTRVTPPNIPPAQHPESLLVQRSAVQICALPNLPGTFPSTDSVVGFGLAGHLPQWRVALPATNTTGSTTTTTNATIISSGSGSSTSSNNPPFAKTASATSPALNPGQSFTGTVLMAKSFYLFSVSVNTAVRVELYSTAAARASDMSRPAATPPGYGNEQGLIADFNLPNAPTIWATDPAVIGGNGDTPQTNVIYFTITNIGMASETPALTLNYVPLQS